MNYTFMVTQRVDSTTWQVSIVRDGQVWNLPLTGLTYEQAMNYGETLCYLFRVMEKGTSNGH